MKLFFKKHWKKIIILLIVVAIGFFIVRGNNKESITSEVKKGSLKEDLILSGDISAINYAKLSFETPGKISFVGVKEGEKVLKGRLISKLDTTVLNSSYQIALSNLRAAEATVANIHNQVKDHSSDETFAQKDLRTAAESNKDKAYEAVIAAKRNLDGGSLYAPFNGIITFLSHPFPGVYSGLGSIEAEIIDPSTMHFNVLADQTEVGKLNLNQKVEIILDPFDDKTFEGVVQNISFVPKTGEASSVYSVKVAFKNVDLENSSFKIAMTGDAKFIVAEKENVLYVPTGFVKQDKDGDYLKLDNKNSKVYITTGIESEDSIEVIGDIKENQVVYD